MGGWLVGWWLSFAFRLSASALSISIADISQKRKVEDLLKEVKARRGTAAVAHRQRGYHSTGARAHRAELHREEENRYDSSRDDRRGATSPMLLQKKEEEDSRDDHSDHRQHGAGRW